MNEEAMVPVTLDREPEVRPSYEVLEANNRLLKKTLAWMSLVQLFSSAVMIRIIVYVLQR